MILCLCTHWMAIIYLSKSEHQCTRLCYMSWNHWRWIIFFMRWNWFSAFLHNSTFFQTNMASWFRTMSFIFAYTLSSLLENSTFWFPLHASLFLSLELSPQQDTCPIKSPASSASHSSSLRTKLSFWLVASFSYGFFRVFFLSFWLFFLAFTKNIPPLQLINC